MCEMAKYNTFGRIDIQVLPVYKGYRRVSLQKALTNNIIINYFATSL